ncbi:hypothetical protein BJV82DRAFT_616101 [Fennellomyces sp. T-0311]|nr:hypothetical protein BJV82DRAFT_616101 [Fennellomyces sp. T-0311]
MQRVAVFFTATLLAFCFLTVQALPLQKRALETRQIHSPDLFEDIPDVGVDGVDKQGVDNSVDNLDVDGEVRNNLPNTTVIEESSSHGGILNGLLGSVGGLLGSLFGPVGGAYSGGRA